MNMIRHQAIAVDINSQFIFHPDEIGKIVSIVFRLHENGFAIMSALHNVQWYVLYKEAAVAWHGDGLHIDSARQI